MKGATTGDKIEAPPAETTKGKKENKSRKTPTVSPDQGTTGETATSPKNMDVGMQTGLSEEEWEACLLKDYDNTLLKMLEIIRARDPVACWDIIIETLFKCFARKNRDKRSEKPDWLNLDKLEALEGKHLETSGSVPDDLKKRMKRA